MTDAAAVCPEQLARLLAAPMFVLSLLFLALLVGHRGPVGRRADVVRAASRGSGRDRCRSPLHAGLAGAGAHGGGVHAGFECLKVLGVLWVFFLVEFLASSSSATAINHSGAPTVWTGRCVCPPLRSCARHPDMDGKVWLPVLGWRRANNALRLRLERLFSVPMILIAMAILPLLLVEYGMRHQVAQHRWLQHTLHVSLGVIWFAFRSRVHRDAQRRREETALLQGTLDRHRHHLVAVRFVPAIPADHPCHACGSAARMEQLVRMSRLYRLRGLAMRALRAMLLLKLINRLFPSDPQKQLLKLREQLRRESRMYVF